VPIRLYPDTMQPPKRRGVFSRLAEWADRKTAKADAEARSYGLAAEATSRYHRVYRDPRCDDLATARAAGCECVPMCRPAPGSSLPACCVSDLGEAA
jgi:hypothetical protein